MPALKSTLLNITRFSLLFLPFVFRYRLVDCPSFSEICTDPS